MSDTNGVAEWEIKMRNIHMLKNYYVCPLCNTALNSAPNAVANHVGLHWKKGDIPYKQAAFFTLVRLQNRKGCNKKLANLDEDVKLWIEDYVGKLRAEVQKRERVIQQNVRTKSSGIGRS